MTPGQQLQLKLTLERSMLIALRAFRKRVVRAFVRHYGATGQLLDMTPYDEALVALLQGHYAAVAHRFTRVISDQLPKDVAQTEEEAQKVRGALEQYFGPTALIHAAGINRTTAGNMAQALMRAQQTVQEKRVEQLRMEAKATAAETLAAAAIVVPVGSDIRELAGIAGVFLNRSIAAREEGIALTETQTAAEAAKVTTVETLTGNYPSILGGDAKPTYVEKTWVTVQDDKVRDWHRAAHGQTRRTDEPFEVGGELLRFPADSGLGASAENIINCRCVAEYNMVDITAARA